MLYAKLRQQREAAVMQAAVVWGLGKFDVDRFIATGELDEAATQQARLSPEQEEQVSMAMAAIRKNGGKFVMPEDVEAVLNGEPK